MTHLNSLDFNDILGRNELVAKFKQLLLDFNLNKTDMSVKRGIYVYGRSGCGKTEFVIRALKEMKYDIIRYDAGDIRNKTIIDTITKHNMSDQSVMSIFEQTPRKIVIVMDEIDGMNTGDKGGITSLIKLIRPKKTKKQKNESYTLNPIICIGNYDMDKKIKEIMKVCHTIELKTPTSPQMRALVGEMMPGVDAALGEKIAAFAQSDIRKLATICDVYVKNNAIINDGAVLETIFRAKSCSENSKLIMTQLFNTSYAISDHTAVINETDRTIIGLLWHENITDMITNSDAGLEFYETVLKNICFADYIDRITFQKQIWIFNEMSSLIKTFYNNELYHRFKLRGGGGCGGAATINPADVRFTKVLTKYSTEYNNSLFIQHLCNQMLMDPKDLVEFFKDLRTRHSDETVSALFEQYEITRLDIDRMYRYIDKFSNGTGVCAGAGGTAPKAKSRSAASGRNADADNYEYDDSDVDAAADYSHAAMTGGMDLEDDCANA
jgi:hypothetical protein